MSVRTLRLPTRSVHMIERNAMALRHNWMVIFSGFVEPVLYLFGIGFGIGSLVRTVNLGDGHAVSYAVFVAPALMASSAMNGAIYESTFNLFYKLRYAKTFESVHLHAGRGRGRDAGGGHLGRRDAAASTRWASWSSCLPSA